MLTEYLISDFLNKDNATAIKVYLLAKRDSISCYG